MLRRKFLQFYHLNALMGDEFFDAITGDVVVPSADVTIDGQIGTFYRYETIFDAFPDDCPRARSFP